MKKESFSSAVFLAMAVAIVYLFYRIMTPFFAPIAYAAVTAIVFQPVYQRLLKRLRSPSLTAGLMCLVVTIVIAAPIAYLLVSLASEAKSALEKLNELYVTGKLTGAVESLSFPGLETLRSILGQYTNLDNLRTDAIVANAVSTVSDVITSQFKSVVANIAETVFYCFMTLNALFFFFRDGDRIVAQIGKIVPLSDGQTDAIFHELRQVVEATIFGGVVVALLQGIVGGALFALVGLPSPVLWGAVMAFLSFLPLVGAFLVFVPAGAYLIVTGSLIKGVIVLSVGIALISQLDNFLRPILIAGKTSLHTLLLFFSILGGIAFFGLLGIVLGPVIAAVTVTLVRIIQRAPVGKVDWMDAKTESELSSPHKSI